MAIYDDKWFECWFVDGLENIPTYILIVTLAPKNTSQIIVVDPLKNDEIVFRGKDYDEVCSWLTAAEFEMIDGRMFRNDHW
jgi:hypothetical protein